MNSWNSRGAIVQSRAQTSENYNRIEKLLIKALSWKVVHSGITYACVEHCATWEDAEEMQGLSKKLLIAYMLLRLCLDSENKGKYVNRTEVLPVSDTKFNKLKREIWNGPTLQELQQSILDRKLTEKAQTPLSIKLIKTIRMKLLHIMGFCTKNIVITPQNMRLEMLGITYSAHLSIEKFRNRAQGVLFWPGMHAAIKDKVSKWKSAINTGDRMQKNPLKPNETPNCTWPKDLFKWNGRLYLIWWILFRVCIFFLSYAVTWHIK